MNLNRFLSYLLFPGITIHEIAHIVACLVLGVRIRKIKIISFDEGYVVHDDSRSYKNIIIAIIPFFFNILISIVCIFLIRMDINLILKILLVWIAISSLFFSVPSKQDAKNVFKSIKKSYTRSQPIWMWLIKIVLLPLTIVVLIISWLFKILDHSFIFRIILVGFWVYLLIII